MMITGLMLDEDDNNGRSSYRQWRPWSRRPPARPAQLPYAHTSIEMMVMVKLVKMVMVMIIAYTSKYISRLNIEQCVYELGRQTYIDDDDDNDDDGGNQGCQDVFQRPTKARKLGMPTFFDDGNDNLDDLMVMTMLKKRIKKAQLYFKSPQCARELGFPTYFCFKTFSNLRTPRIWSLIVGSSSQLNS